MFERDVGADAALAQAVDLAELCHGNPEVERAVCVVDLLVGDRRGPGQLPHPVAGFVERDEAVFEQADHLGGVVGLDDFGYGIHSESAECGAAAFDVEVHEDASEVEDHIFDLFHSQG